MQVFQYCPMAEIPPKTHLLSSIWSYRRKRRPTGQLLKYKTLCRRLPTIIWKGFMGDIRTGRDMEHHATFPPTINGFELEELKGRLYPSLSRFA
jgi:hypothetical protein